MAVPNLTCLIMAGGQGTRFWPWSTPEVPKQYLPLTGARSMIRDTFERVAPLVSDTFVCTTSAQEALARRELPEVKRYVLEPVGRNTAPCLMLSTAEMLRSGVSGDSVMMVLPADHFIRDVPGFQRIIRDATRFAYESRGLVTLGIVPTHPHTGYGYIEAGAPELIARKIRRFVEKPNLEKAEAFLKTQGFFWNSGMFFWRLDALSTAFETHLTEAWKQIRECRNPAQIAKVYESLPSVPIDTAVMEKASNGYVIPADIGWSDVGSWNALHELKAASPSDNVVLSGEMKSVESEGCLVALDGSRKIALVGVRDLIIVESGGTLLIVDKKHDQLVREASKLFKS